MRAPATAVVLLALLAAACARSGPGPRNAEMGAFHNAGVGAKADPTVRPAKLFPETVDEKVNYGSEAGGGVRVITAGLRVVTSPKGAIVTADDRLPSAPQSTVQLPDRLGGGFLFVIGTTLWRADRWLGPAKPIYTSMQPVQAVIVGLDRVYVRSQSSASDDRSSLVAIDGRSGELLDLGPWPASPYVASYAAADGWRAAAVTDLRGVVATFDAGATWRSLDLPMDPKLVVASGDSLALGGFDIGTTETWYELRPDGSLTHLGAAPRDVKTKLVPTPPRSPAGGIAATRPPFRPTPTAAPAPTNEPEKDKEDPSVKTFGKRPLSAAIEDGWPLTDGTAVVARDGALARVRLSDGALIELVRDAFPLKTARCHPVTLTRPTAVGAFGFVCGEPRGTTAIYAYEPLRGGLLEIKRFDNPRVVASSGNGALAVRGPCTEDGEPAPPPRPDPARVEKTDDRGKAKEPPTAGEKAKDDKTTKSSTPVLSEKTAPKPEAKASETKEPPRAPVIDAHPYCILGHDDTWREIHVSGDIGGERVVALADGRIVVVSPPQGLGMPARLTTLDRPSSPKDKPRATTVPISFPRVTNDVGRVLRLGLWLDGFEERRPGVIGGWIEAGGSVLGVELTLDGKATLGQFIRDAGMPFVSGRYGLGWTTSQRGFETIDGGMTWTSIDLPTPLLPGAKVERRACGPVGCLAWGWLRVGWGTESKRKAVSPPPPRSTLVNLAIPRVQLSCEPLGSMPRAPAAPRHPLPAPPAPSPRIHFGGLGGPPVLGSFNGLSELPPFFAHAAPALRDSDRGINIDVRELLERHPNSGSLARVYGWGPRTGEWDTLGRWQVKWLSPFGGWPEVRASLPAQPPQMILDMTRAATTSYGYTIGANTTQLAIGDDSSHALLIGRHLSRSELAMFELEADRAPVEVRRADGEPFGEIESAVRAAGRWFVATPPSPNGGMLATVIWQIEGGIARELARVPRTLPQSSSGAANRRTKLARRSDGRAIALVVEGQESTERLTSTRWALPIDLESGALGEPESLGYVDLAGRTLDACTDDLTGWVLDTSLPFSSVRIRLPHGGGSLSSVLGRLRMTNARTCIERLAGNYDGQSQESAAQLAHSGVAPASERVRGTPPLRGGEILATAMSMQNRFALRCSPQKLGTK